MERGRRVGRSRACQVLLQNISSPPPRRLAAICFVMFLLQLPLITVATSASRSGSIVSTTGYARASLGGLMTNDEPGLLVSCFVYLYLTGSACPPVTWHQNAAAPYAHGQRLCCWQAPAGGACRKYVSSQGPHLWLPSMQVFWGNYFNVYGKWLSRNIVLYSG